MAFGKVGPASLEGIIDVAALVGFHIDLNGFVGHTHLYLIVADGATRTEDRGGDAGVVDDAHRGVFRYLVELLMRVAVPVVLRHVDADVIAAVLSEDGVTKAVAVAGRRHREHLDGVGAVVGIGDDDDALAKHAFAPARLSDVDGGLAAILAYHLRAVLILLAAACQGVALHALLDGVGGIDQGQVLCKDGLVVVDGVALVAFEADALHLILQRGQQGRELARLRVGLYIYIMCTLAVDDCRIVGIFLAGTAPGGAADGSGGTRHGQRGSAVGAHTTVVYRVVERALALPSQTQFDGGLAQSVLRQGEAHGSLVVAIAAVDAAGDVHQRRVHEVHRLGLLEFPYAAVEGEACQAVAVLVGLDAVVADGHVEFVLTVAVAHVLL